MTYIIVTGDLKIDHKKDTYEEETEKENKGKKYEI